MTDDKLPTERGRSDAVQEFLQKVASTPRPSVSGPRGRLIFAMDATASRQPTWDRAMDIQAEMFTATAALGGLDVQLVYYRGFNECKVTPFVSNAPEMLRRMTGVACLGGKTQIGRVLNHALKETTRRKVNAVVFVGDAMEEDADHLCDLAGRLGLQNTPVFMFHEGGDPAVRLVFEQIAKLSGGAYAPFDASSAQQLRDLLGAVAAFAAGGRPALQDYSKGRGEAVRLLVSHVR